MPKVRPLHFPVFLTGVLLTIAFVAYAAWSSADHRRTDALHTAEVYSARLETLMGGLFHKTDVLESVIIAGHGHIPETVFEDLARSLADGAGIRAVQYLPDGVVTYCYPREGNEAVMGTSVFTNPKRRADALLAVNSRSIVLSGPYSLFQGGLGLVARNPIFLTEADGREKFWGFAALILDLPEALKPVFLDALRQEGYAYRLHCRGEHGDDLTIAQSGVMPSGRPVDYGIQVPNHAWTLSLAPEGGWVDTRELPLQLGLGFVISGLCAVVAHQRREKERLLRQAAETDDLTGLYNRRKLNRVVDALCRAPQPAHFVFLYMDLNAFKACNDTLG
ncbi:MAG: CHASE domain-containing protein, partial [Desulfovibrio fairfieldensis]|nr:CHASE domain-containing protein [Desulfovibrio fairfieldensis]